MPDSNGRYGVMRSFPIPEGCKSGCSWCPGWQRLPHSPVGVPRKVTTTPSQARFRWSLPARVIPCLTVHLVGRYHPRRGRNVPPPTTSPAQETKTGPISTNSSSRGWSCFQVISLPTTSLNPLPTAKGRNVPQPTVTMISMVPVPQKKAHREFSEISDDISLRGIGEASEGS